MGTRTNMLLSHSLDDWRDRDASVTVLSETLPAVNAVDSYWSTAGEAQKQRLSEWIAEPEFPPSVQRDYYRYTGPGLLSVDINPSAVWVSAGCRWRGFLSIQALRDAHLLAFQAIAGAFGVIEYFCFADNDFVSDVYWEGGDVAGCLEVLKRQFGNAGVLVREIDPEIALKAEHGVPGVWYRGTAASHERTL